MRGDPLGSIPFGSSTLAAELAKAQGTIDELRLLADDLFCGDRYRLLRGLSKIELALLLGKGTNSALKGASRLGTATAYASRLRQLRALHAEGKTLFDYNSTVKKHTIGGSEAKTNQRKGKGVHVFNEGIDLRALAELAWQHGEYVGNFRGWERIMYRSNAPIGVRMQGEQLTHTLYYVELKIRWKNGVWEYHIDPRVRPSGPSE